VSTERIRIGIVGAVGNVRHRHAPGFQAIPGVEIVSVCNRGRESSERAAAEFGIPTVYDNWLDLVEADDTDAICIGTWPYMHAPITLAALENDKHVLTEARMAANADEARAMLDASRAAPHLAAQVVPAPFSLPVDRTIQDLISDGYLGDLLTVEMRVTQRGFVDADAPLAWRHDAGLSGFNVLSLGIWYESLMRWIGPAASVMAMTKTVVKRRRDAQGMARAVSIPDHVDVLCEMACGAQAHMRFSAVTGLAPGGEIWLYGSQGTLRLDTETGALSGGRKGDEELTDIDIPEAKKSSWRVEEEFINAIRGIEPVTHTTFEAGVRYMEFTEAVARSARSGRTVWLPL
jgi:predicted dehydrogenase